MRPLAQPSDREQLDPVETDILDVLSSDFGYDYQAAGVTWLKRMLQERVAAERLQTTKGFREKVLHDEGCRMRLLRSLTSPERTLFHDPAFYRAFRETVAPWLRTYPFLRFWIVGCGSGQEVYSMAILLEEAGLYERCRIYATDPDEALLKQARDGIFPLTVMQSSTQNYLEFGGERPLSQYYVADYDQVMFRASLKKNVVFAQHDLETDGPFNEFHVIVCRDFLSALTRSAQSRAHGLFLDSLVHLGFLCLGAPTATAASIATAEYEANELHSGIFRRRR